MAEPDPDRDHIDGSPPDVFLTEIFLPLLDSLSGRQASPCRRRGLSWLASSSATAQWYGVVREMEANPPWRALALTAIAVIPAPTLPGKQHRPARAHRIEPKPGQSLS